MFKVPPPTSVHTLVASQRITLTVHGCAGGAGRSKHGEATAACASTGHALVTLVGASKHVTHGQQAQCLDVRGW